LGQSGPECGCSARDEWSSAVLNMYKIIIFVTDWENFDFGHVAGMAIHVLAINL